MVAHFWMFTGLVAAVRSKVVVLLLYIYCLLFISLLWEFRVGSLFLCVLICVLSSFAIILLRKKKQVALF